MRRLNGGGAAKRVSKVMAVTAVLAATWATANASVAFASYDTFMGNQGLSAGNAYASSSVHSYVNQISVDTDHTACPAVALGYSGYTSTPFSGGHNTAYQSYACGYTQGGRVPTWYPNPTSGSLHGAVYNPNGSTFDYITFAVYYW